LRCQLGSPVRLGECEGPLFRVTDECVREYCEPEEVARVVPGTAVYVCPHQVEID
jgi:hypothetical protein